MMREIKMKGGEPVDPADRVLGPTMTIEAVLHPEIGWMAELIRLAATRDEARIEKLRALVDLHDAVIELMTLSELEAYALIQKPDFEKHGLTAAQNGDSRLTLAPRYVKDAQ